MNSVSLQALYLDHAARLVGFARLRLRSREDAEDVVQGVFLKLYENQVKVPECGRAFLTTCVRNAVLDFMRHRRLVLAEFGELPDDLFECSAEDSELQGAVAEALRLLPTEQREVIVLHAFQGFRLREIAEVTASQPATVASRLRYARLKLRPVLRRFAKGPRRDCTTTAPEPALIGAKETRK
jgi:RNA polymerase sigma-70 factor (ECF subfamily)